MPERKHRSDAWAEDAEEAPIRAWSRQEVAEWRRNHPQASPWWVVGWQAVAGAGLALVAWLFTQDKVVSWSLLDGAAVVVVPGALMARGMTSKLTSMTPGTGVVSFVLWELVKIGVAVAMLMLASRIVQPLSWPALIVGLVVCINLYWVALLRRAPPLEQQD